MKKVPIKYSISGKTRSVDVPKTRIMHLAIEPLPSAHPSGETWAAAGHPVAPDKLAFGVGGQGNWFADHGMRWDNSGKNGHYAQISWSGQPAGKTWVGSSAGKGTCPTGRLTACCCATVGLSAAALPQSPSSPPALALAAMGSDGA